MSNFWNGGTGTPKNEDHALDILPQHKDENGTRRDGGDDSTTSTARPIAKIKALDGLRGIACFLVFNYHFLWPWTPLIMLGYGARPPKSPEPLDGSFWQLPIICLLHRGRPMVAIFFAISGYVLVRHVQREIHARRFSDAYAKLASGVFRRIWRLYIPCTVSMFAVAMLAQVGVFRSEKSIFKGPDSAWINGTVTKGFFRNGTCPNNTVAVEGRLGVAELLGLRTEVYLNETIKDTDQLCLNTTSKLHMPATLYFDVEKPKKNKTASANTTSSKVFTDFAEYHRSDAHNPASKANAKSLDLTGTANNATQNFTWIQLGGSWEEHPIIHPHIFKALANFTVVYSEWANPFQFGHMHPRYDPHTWTIPKELRGSMVIYTFLLGTAALKARWRLTAAAGLATYAITMGFWDMGVFVGGMLLSELDLLRTTEPSNLSNEDRLFVATLFSGGGGRGGGGGGGGGITQVPTTSGRISRWATIIVAFYLLSYPDAAAEFTPGFRTLSALVPRWYIPVSKWMFYQAIGALLLLPCVLRSPTLRGLLESSVPQYLGRISFSFYLVHGPVLHSLGFWVMPRLFERLGKVGGYVVGYVGLLAIALWVSGWFYRKVDVWSLGVGRRLERMLVNS